MRPLPERLAALALGAVAALPGLAREEAEAPPWYRVELLVFRYTDPAALTAERWPVYPDTAYPERYRFLIDRKLADRRLEEHAGAESRIDDRGRQVLRLASRQVAPDPNALPAAVPNLLPLLPLEPQRPDGHVGAARPRDPSPAAGAADPDAPPPLPPAFTRLPTRALPAYRLVRDSGYEVLWHEAWVQPLAAQDEAVPLLLDRAGDPDRAPWPRLQGSVRLYLSRYLHLETALWLNTEGSYLPDGWRAEAPPLAPPSLVLEPAPLPRRDPAEALLAGEPRRPDGRLADGRRAWDGPPAAREFDDRTGAALADDPNAPPDPDAAAVWPWRHSVVLEARRRMRSGETHYLDHPLFGVVVRLEPLDAAALETLGEALADPGWAERHGRAQESPAKPAGGP